MLGGEAKSVASLRGHSGKCCLHTWSTEALAVDMSVPTQVCCEITPEMLSGEESVRCMCAGVCVHKKRSRTCEAQC